MSKIVSTSLSVKNVIPVIEFGSLTVELHLTAELDEGDTLEAVSKELFKQAQRQIIGAVLPIVEAKVEALLPVMMAMPQQFRESQLTSDRIYNWLVTNCPSVKLAEPVEDVDAKLSALASSINAALEAPYEPPQKQTQQQQRLPEQDKPARPRKKRTRSASSGRASHIKTVGENNAD